MVLQERVRFPQAFLLIPCALGCSWLLNIVRFALSSSIMNAALLPKVADSLPLRGRWISFTIIGAGVFTGYPKTFLDAKKFPRRFLRRRPAAE